MFNTDHQCMAFSDDVAVIAKLIQIKVNVWKREKKKHEQIFKF